MNAIAHPLSTRRSVLVSSALLALASLVPHRVFAQEGMIVLNSTTPFDGKIATVGNLQEFALLGLRHADPAAGWERVDYLNHKVLLFSAAYPSGTEISYDHFMNAADAGLAKMHPRYAGRSLQAAFDGNGLIGAYLA